MLLFINTSSYISKYIKEYLDGSGYDYAFIDEPDDNQERFVSELLSIVSIYKVNRIFSIDFYPQISLACGVLGLEYISWIIDGGREESYDFTIGNKWNRIFTADYTLLSRLSGRCNISYYPLGYTVELSSEEVPEPTEDLLFWSSITHDLTSIGGLLMDLKDSSKGYIDSMIEQRKNDLCDWLLYENFADYVTEDVEKNYPIECTSFEEKAWAYNRKYLFEEMDLSYAFPYIHYVSLFWKNRDGIRIALEDWEKLPFFENYRISQKSIIETDYNDVNKYKATVVFQKIREGNIISLDTWNILAKGGLVFLPEWIYYDSDSSIITFKNKRELFYKIAEYLNDEQECIKRKKKCQQFALNNGSIRDRIRNLLEKYCLR